MQRLGTISKTRVRYCTLSDDQIRYMNPDTFRDLNLSTYLTSYQFTTSAPDWARNKEILFPGLHSDIINLRGTTVQGWRMVPLYEEYLKLRASDQQFEDLRAFCWEMYDTLKWFPKVSRDRLIDNKKRTTWKQVFAGGLKSGTPITINPNFSKEPITALPNVPPVLSLRTPGDQDEESEMMGDQLSELRESHQETLLPIAQAVFGDVPQDEPPEPGPSQPSGMAVEFAKRHYGKKRGRRVVAEDSESENEGRRKGRVVHFVDLTGDDMEL
ncbi:hypothetical protein LENED_002917 [Lentinula edodes]|uniref:Uncharacterized protein n=1 Tax=Lentinula edodes TaxID=5353 RepID=A0A1Q3E255_LENED|nr:hypothetical protein LENED_002917 [Lentinula edodes]